MNVDMQRGEIIVTELDFDKRRYGGGGVPKVQKYYRKAYGAKNILLSYIYRALFAWYKSKNHIDLYYKTQIGEGLYIGHPYGITINAETILGKNVNIHKGVTIGQENRGKRKGTPIIGNEVWIGINATIVGAIKIGDDVLIAPNTFVNCDIPDHSIVFGNPCMIKHCDNATATYINNKI